MAFTIIVVLLAILYVLSIIWVIRDAYLRGTTWYLWGLVALIPFVGVIAYLLLRPPLLQIDRDEQELEILLKQRQLMQYGECASCGYPVEVNYIICPNCHTQLKNQCSSCGHALEPTWAICPYCATPVTGSSDKMRQQRRRTHKKSANPKAKQSSGNASNAANVTVPDPAEG